MLEKKIAEGKDREARVEMEKKTRETTNSLNKEQMAANKKVER